MSLEELPNLNFEIKRRGSDADNKFMKLFNTLWALKHNDSLIAKYLILKTTRSGSLHDYLGIKKCLWEYQFGLKRRNDEFVRNGGTTLEAF